MNLPNCFSPIRTDENKIRSLQQENESQGDQLDALEEEKEMVYSEMISNRCTKACIESVDSKLNDFVTQLRALDASQDTAAIELRNVKTRFVISFAFSSRSFRHTETC